MFSAAQALALSIKARMNDLEFEAFRINSARTQLSQEANQLGDQMAGLDLPVPPSMRDFTQIEYTFAIGNDQMTIENVRPYEGAYNVTATFDRVDHYMNRNGSFNVRYNQDDSNYYVGDTRLLLLGDDDTGIPEETLNGYIAAIRYSFEEYAEEEPDVIKNSFYVYHDVTSTGRDVYYFMKKDDVERQGRMTTPNGYSVPAYEYIPGGTHQERITYSECKLEFDASGRITQVSIPTYNEQGQLIRYIDHAVTANTVSDEAGYNDAYNQYQYEKYKYDQDQGRLEHEIEVIQRQDKNLEMKLTKIENERNALKTELEGVEKVIEDGTEDFKAFA